MRVGLVGFEGSGKSTLFKALAGDRAAGGAAPSAEQVAVVTHENDERLLRLDGIYRAKKRTPITFELHDFPGLRPPGSAEGGYRATKIADVVEGLVLVVRGFRSEQYYYPRPEPDPAADARDLILELVLADLEKATRRVEKLSQSVKKPTPRQEEEKRELKLMERVVAALEAETPLKSLDLTEAESKALRGFDFLTAMPWLLLVSAPDEGNGTSAAEIEGPFEHRLDLRVKLESELLDLPEDEREVFMEELGVERLALPGFLDLLLGAMGMIRFYTCGDNEVRCWELPKGGTASRAAGRVHTDLERGFIRAEVMAYDDLIAAGSEAGVKAAGKFRLEGRDYVVKDGDILLIRFSV